MGFYKKSPRKISVHDFFLRLKILYLTLNPKLKLVSPDTSQL